MDKSDINFMLTLLLGLVLTVIGIRAIDVNQTRKVCDRFSLESNRETKFANYTYWSYECLTPSSDGKTWISTNKLREVND